MSDENNQLILISGFSAAGKSASLRNIRNQEKWYYLGTESGKALPFKNKFRVFNITDPLQIYEAFDVGKDSPDCEGIVIDSLTYLLDMYESQYVLPAANGLKAWSDFAQFFKVLMQDKVAKFGKPVIFTAHVQDFYDEKAMENKTYVPVKGSLKANGIESYFSVVVSAKKMPLKDLESYKNDLLNITDEEKELGLKYVYQTRITKTTTGERIRGPMGLFSRGQTYIDNDAQLLLDYLNEYYK